MNQQPNPFHAMHRATSRRSFLGLGLAATAGLATASCSSDGNDTTDGGVTGDVVFWHPYGQETRQAELQVAFDIFEEEHPGARVQAEYVPFGDLPLRWPAAQQGGTLPDLMINIPENILPMHIAGVIDTDALGSLVEELGGEPFFAPGFLDKNGRYQGDTFAIPHYAHNRLMLYRSDRLAAAGLEVPETLADVEECAAAMNNPPDFFGWTMPLSQNDIGGGYLLWMITRSNGGSLVDPEGNQFWASDEVRAAADYLGRIASQYGPTSAATTAIGDTFNRFHDGTASMVVDTAANIAVANSTEGLDPELVASLNGTHIPAGTQPGHMVGSVAMTIPVDANVAAAHELAKVLYRPEVHLDFLLSIPMFHFPATTNIDTDAFFGEPLIAQYKDTVVAQTLAGIDEGSVAGFEDGPNPFIGPILDAKISEVMIQDIAFGGMGVDAALEKAAAAADEIVARIQSQIS
ncbi:ABC transporter substrate-binding protein [Occultella gossypii]|uniref:Extracellular solute-binding protein n=1 Tax=Occultella gossypii TaxID=2800820 RepID=A0ABS7S2V5_9MICO|nr:extracellular solute-binding protein [Occultella gossypii]MBZ2194671.1 extracellular solute-binding protein [Occultella gossypii]